MSDTPDYRKLTLPTDKPPAEYTYAERRAEILNFIEQAGGPQNVTQARLAERYGVSESQISQDMDRLGEYIGDHLGDDVHLSLYALRGRVVSELLDADDWRATAKAWTVAREFAEWAGVDPVAGSGPDHAPTDVAGGIEPSDNLVIPELSEKDKEHLANLKQAAEQATASTRVDKNGDDLPAQVVRGHTRNRKDTAQDGANEVEDVDATDHAD